MINIVSFIIGLVIKIIYIIMGIILLPLTLLVTYVGGFLIETFGEDGKVAVVVKIISFLFILLSVPVGFYLLFLQ